jgi:predicted DNA-binding transcriptional regulator YafY
MRDAFFASRVVDVEYLGAADRPTRRSIEPQYLLVNAPAWYVLAFDLGKRAGRTFRLDRITRASVTDVSFTTRPAASLSDDVETYFDPA